MLVVAFGITGCSLPIPAGYDNLKTQDEIKGFIISAMEQNKTDCQFNVPEEELIDINRWIKIAGVKNIGCEYKKVTSGYDVKLTMTYWDNYPIIYAYKNNDKSKLSAKQKELLEEYVRVLDIIEGKSTEEAQSESTTKETESQSVSNSEKESESQTEAKKELTVADKILAAHDYLVENVTYDSSLDYMYDAYTTMLGHKATCSGYAEAFKTFMDMLEVENMTITGKAGDGDHMWNLVKLDGDWYHVDVTWDDPIGNKTSSIYHTYFNVDDEAIATDHTWEKDNFPAATGTKYSYTNMKGIKVLKDQEELEEYVAELVKDGKRKAEILVYGKSDIKVAFTKLPNRNYSYNASKIERKDYTMYTITIKY